MLGISNYLYCLHPVVRHDVAFWPSAHEIYEKLNHSNITVLCWFYLVTATYIKYIIYTRVLAKIACIITILTINTDMDPY
jgi:hypothetical protein